MEILLERKPWRLLYALLGPWSYGNITWQKTMASFVCPTWSLVLWKYYLRYDHELLDLLQQRQYRYSMNDYVSLWYSWINLVVLIVRLENKIRKLYGLIGKANNNASLMSEEIFYYTTILCIKWQGLRIVYTQCCKAGIFANNKFVVLVMKGCSQGFI